ncbi:hypothetical protein ABT187_49920 [Streptomyces sp. NPDC001817]|uniref:hypothetical protein n=1 Tax=Streptomyces sp. NPDC001817 TaxID=3154398 RepID=UPI0033320D8C
MRAQQVKRLVVASAVGVLMSCGSVVGAAGAVSAVVLTNAAQHVVAGDCDDEGCVGGNGGYVVPGYGNGGYVVPGYGNGGYVVPGYENGGYVVPGYENGGYVVPGYENGGYVVPGYGNSGGYLIDSGC